MLLLQAVYVAPHENSRALVPTKLEVGDIVDIVHIPRVGNGFCITRRLTSTKDELGLGFEYRPLWFETSDVAILDDPDKGQHIRCTPYCKIPDENRVLEVLSALVTGAGLNLFAIKDGGGRYTLVKSKATHHTIEAMPMTVPAAAVTPITAATETNSRVAA